MAQRGPEMVTEDAKIDGIRQGSRFGLFVRGVFLGVLGCGVALIGLTLSQPLPQHLPGVGRVEIVTPQSSVEDTAAPVSASEEGGDAQTDAQADAAQAPTDDNSAPDADAPVEETTAQSTDADDAPAPSETAEPSDEAPVEVEIAQTPSDAPAEVEVAQPSDDAPAEAETAATSAADDTEQQAQDAAANTDTAEQTGTVDEAEPETETASEAQATDAPQETQETAAADDATSGTTDAAAQDQPAATEEADAQSDDSIQQAALAPLEPAQPAPSEPADVEEPVQTAALGPVPELKLSGPAVEVNARSFNAPANAPLMAVVLEDPGSGGIVPNTMALLTMPLTFAVRPDREGAQELAGAARIAGHEVLAHLPLVALDGDAETPTAFSSAATQEALATATRRVLAGLDVAIGASVPAGAAQLNDLRTMEAVLAPLAENGFAYLELRTGIGSIPQRVSEDAGITFAESDRYAEASASEAQIYQMLDGAAFQARRRGTVVVSVGANSDALKAIVRWGLERGGQEVWFAPLSAVIARRREG